VDVFTSMLLVNVHFADPPLGEDEWQAPEDGFAYGVDLVRFIRKTYGDYFVIAVGGQFLSVYIPKSLNSVRTAIATHFLFLCQTLTNFR